MIFTDIQETPIDVFGLTERAHDDGSGAVVTFEGTTRNNGAGPNVTTLEYEAHVPLAGKQLRTIAETAVGRFGLARVVVVHRTGLVDVGDVGVFVAVSAPHRAEAFAGCAYVIDTLKHEAAIWKKEHYANGASAWIGCATEEQQ